MPPCGFIYKIVFPNGKHYIGLTTISIEHRAYQHKSCAKCGDNKILYNAIRKYDMVNNIELIEIDTADNIEELCEKEIRYIQEYNSYFTNGNGYNMTYGGEFGGSYIFTEDDKKKMSESATLYYQTDGAKQKQSEIITAVFKNNPKLGKEHSKRMKKRFENNPELGKAHSERMKKRFENNPELGNAHSERMKLYYKNNPEAKKEWVERIKMRDEDNPEAKLQRINRSLDAKGQNKPFDVCKTDGTFIKTFIYQHDAKEYLQKEHAIKGDIKICEVLSGRLTSSKGFVFKYKNLEEKLPRTNHVGRKGQNKPFDVCNLDGTVIKTFTYQIDAKEYLQKEHAIKGDINIGEVLSGRRTSSKGFVFKYK
jgi:hypothetical protein